MTSHSPSATHKTETELDFRQMQIDQVNSDGPFWAVFCGKFPPAAQVGVHDNWPGTSIAREFPEGNCKKQPTWDIAVMAVQMILPN